MGFGEESWEEISGDTLGDVGEQRMADAPYGFAFATIQNLREALATMASTNVISRS